MRGGANKGERGELRSDRAAIQTKKSCSADALRLFLLLMPPQIWLNLETNVLKSSILWGVQGTKCPR